MKANSFLALCSLATAYGAVPANKKAIQVRI